MAQRAYAKHKNVKKALSKREMRQFLTTIVYVLNVFVIVLALFNFSLTLSNSWDDVNMGVAFLAPILAVIAFAIAYLDVYRYNAKGHEILSSAIVLLVAALFLMYSMFGFAIIQQL